MVPATPKIASSRKKIRILLVDDHMVIRMGLITATTDAADMEVVADVESGLEALEAFRRCHPDIVILDLRLPGMNGIETMRALKGEFKQVRVLIFSNYATGDEIHQAMKAGAAGFVLKE